MTLTFAAPRLLALAAALLVAPAAFADEADIRKSIETLYGKVKVETVHKTGILGLYEVQVGHDIVYTDEKGSYFFVGDILDAKAHRNLTEERKNKLVQIKFADLPVDLAVKTVRGDGSRVFATFEDPNCVYCRKLAKDMAGMTDITMYTFLYPILAADSTDKAKAIWCAPDRSAAWRQWMIDGVLPQATSCSDPTDKVVALAQKLGIQGTPTIFFADGNRIPSYIPAAKLEEMLNKTAAAK